MSSNTRTDDLAEAGPEPAGVPAGLPTGGESPSGAPGLPAMAPPDSLLPPTIPGMRPTTPKENAKHARDTRETKDLRFLASANFSTESLDRPITPKEPSFSPQHDRRYSGSVGGSPIIQPSAAAHVRANSTSSTRPRPRSGIFTMDSSNFAISEDGSPVNAPKRRSYIPPGAHSMNFSSGPPPVPAPRSPTRSTSPVRATRQYRQKSPVRRATSPSKSPFNFQSQDMQQTSSLKPAHRKGHKYKHSSVSMNLFQEAPPAVSLTSQQLAIPDSYPIPNLRESVASVTPSQKVRLLWSGMHMALSLAVFSVGLRFKMASLSTLAHLVFYDALGSAVIVLVDVMSNFEVWKSSSLVYPFGLGRLEVLVGFALGASLVMVGCDLVSHFVEEFVIMMVVANDEAAHASNHKSHHVHSGEGQAPNMWVYMGALVVTICTTLVTSNYILGYDRISEMMNRKEEVGSKKGKRSSGGLLDSEKVDSLDTPLHRFATVCSKNPTHLLTLCYSVYLLVCPFLPGAEDVNEIMSLMVALLLCNIGWGLVKVLGGILMCSYPHSDYDYYMVKNRVMDRMMALDFFKQAYSVQKFYITKFNYELYVVGMRLDMRGASPDDESRLIFEVNRIVRGEVGGEVEITIDVTRY